VTALSGVALTMGVGGVALLVVWVGMVVFLSILVWSLTHD
jgi:hypothetical protein